MNEKPKGLARPAEQRKVPMCREATMLADMLSLVLERWQKLMQAQKNGKSGPSGVELTVIDSIENRIDRLAECLTEPTAPLLASIPYPLLFTISQLAEIREMSMDALVQEILQKELGGTVRQLLHLDGWATDGLQPSDGGTPESEIKFLLKSIERFEALRQFKVGLHD